MAAAPRLIKKYPNRRLYDTGISSYVTLEGIRQLVLHGEAFEVHAAATGKDITRSILLQVIAEHEQQGQPLLPSSVLLRLIRLYGDALQGRAGAYLEHSLAVFAQQQQTRHYPLDESAEHNPVA